MATVIDSLFISLGVDTKGVASGMARAESSIAASAKSIVSNILAPLGAALALGSAFKEFVAGAADAATFANSLGESVEDIGAWGQAVSRAGGNVAGLEGTLLSLNSKMLEFSHTGTSSAAPAFAMLGISARNADGSIKSSLDIMKNLATAADAIDPKRFNAIASSLGVDSGSIALLGKGSAAVSELIARQKALGLYTKEDGEIAIKMSNAFKDFIQVMKSLSSMLMRVVVPPFTIFTQKLVDLVTYLKSHETFLKAAIIGVAAAITAVLIPAMAKLGLAALKNPMTWIWASIALVIGLVALAMEDLYVYIKGGNTAFSGLWSKFGTGKEIAEKLSTSWENFKITLSGILETLKNFAPAILQLVAGFAGAKFVIALISSIGAGFASLIGIIKGVGAAFKAFTLLISMNPIGAAITAIAALLILLIIYWDDVKMVAQKAIDFMADKLAMFKEKIVSIFESLQEKVFGVFNKISAVMAPIMSGIKSVVGNVSSFFDIDDKDGKNKDKGSKEDGFFKKVLNFTTPASFHHSLPPTSYGGNSKIVNSNSQISVGEVNIQTGATDPKEIAAEMPKALASSFQNFGVLANSGIMVK